MHSKLLSLIRRYQMVQPGDRVVCAVSGGADSVALLLAMHLLKDKLQITLSAAHFNHHLRGEESDRDAEFVRQLCDRYDIPCTLGSGNVVTGKKGLEAAARDARYGFLKSLPGKIATAHTADDNAETVLMHMVRGTGLKGLGGISPVNGVLIRPMLEVTRQEVLAFLQEYHQDYVTDSSNAEDAFLRNRLRHHVMPLLTAENPKLAQNLSAMALRLRQDEQALQAYAQTEILPDVSELRQMPPAILSRVLSNYLEQCGVPEPEAEHVALAQSLVFSTKPSACAQFPGGVTLCRNYGRIEQVQQVLEIEPVEISCPGEYVLPREGLKVTVRPAQQLSCDKDRFTVAAEGSIILRSRQAGDTMRCPGGTKSLKKLFIDSKLPAVQRKTVPVLADKIGVLGVYGFGANRDRIAAAMPAVEIQFTRM